MNYKLNCIILLLSGLIISGCGKPDSDTPPVNTPESKPETAVVKTEESAKTEVAKPEVVQPEIKPTAELALPEAEPALPEAEPALPEAEPALPEAEPALPEAEPALPEAEPAFPEVEPALPEAEPALPEAEPTEIKPEAEAPAVAISTEDMNLVELPESPNQAEEPVAPGESLDVTPGAEKLSPAPSVSEIKPELEIEPVEPLVTPEALAPVSEQIEQPEKAEEPSELAPPSEITEPVTKPELVNKTEPENKTAEAEEPDEPAHQLPPPPKRETKNAAAVVDIPAAPVPEPPASAVKTESKDAVFAKDLPFDPVKENGTIFVGWDKPLVALVMTGQQNGYLEPCGCAGLDRMKGGLSRRFTFIESLRAKDWNVIAMDVGGMCNGFGKQAELKFHTTAAAMRAMQYDAVALGKAELGFPAADILSEIVNADSTQSMFVSSNVSVFEKATGMPPAYKIVEGGGLKFGITSALCKSAQNFGHNDDILLSSTKESLDKAVAVLKQQSDIRVLLSHGTVDEARQIAKDYPDFQIIVTAGGNPEPPAEPEILPSGQYIITVGEKGMSAIVLGFFEDHSIKYQRVPQDSRFAASDKVRQMMQSYQDQLKQLWLTGLGIRPVPQQDPSRGANVGAKKCATCHEFQYDVWRKTKHATAFHSLETATPPRDYDPECVCCHVVGWHRHLYFPYQKGFTDHQKDEHLKNVSCEACHGAGEAHIAAEATSNTANQEAQRAKLRIDLKYAKEKMCGDCHDLDNSPDFDPDKYWEQIKHYEPEDE